MWRSLALAVLLTTPPGVAQGAWAVNERDECVRVWTPASLLRGPSAFVNGPLVPVRSAAGGVAEATDPAVGTVGKRIVLTPVLGGLAAAGGVLEGTIWVATGIADTLTGGYFEIAPDDATDLSVAPMVPFFAPDSRRSVRDARHEDRCGRPAARPTSAG